MTRCIFSPFFFLFFDNKTPLKPYTDEDMFQVLFPTGENNIIMQASIAIMLLPGKESSPAVLFQKILLLLLEIVVSKSWLDGM